MPCINKVEKITVSPTYDPQTSDFDSLPKTVEGEKIHLPFGLIGCLYKNSQDRWQITESTSGFKIPLPDLLDYDETHEKKEVTQRSIKLLLERGDAKVASVVKQAIALREEIKNSQMTITREEDNG